MFLQQSIGSRLLINMGSDASLLSDHGLSQFQKLAQENILVQNFVGPKPIPSLLEHSREIEFGVFNL